MGLGFQELVVIFLIVVVLFGATRLPQLGKGLGEGIAYFKRGLRSGDRDLGPGEPEDEDKAPRPAE